MFRLHNVTAFIETSQLQLWSFSFTFTDWKWPLGTWKLLKTQFYFFKNVSLSRTFHLVWFSSDSPNKGNGASRFRWSQVLIEVYLWSVGSRRQTESWRYELRSQTIIAFSFVLFILVSLFCLQAAAKEGKGEGKGTCTSLQPHINAQLCCSSF